RLARPALEILLALLPPDLLDRALDPHLPLQRLPEEAQRRPRIARQLAPLAAVVVGVEGEAARVEGLQQDDPRRRVTGFVDRRERHGVRLKQLRVERVL